MGKQSAIGWVAYQNELGEMVPGMTFNGWIGCTKVSPGCTNCYAEARDLRFAQKSWGVGKPRRKTSDAYWAQARQWNHTAEVTKTRPRVFSASLSDWLDAEVPVAWLTELLGVIWATPHLDWLLLTKRPERWAEAMQAVVANPWAPDGKRELLIPGRQLAMEWLGGKSPDNVWMGVTVESPAQYPRITQLEAIPAKLRFLSCEPLLSSLTELWRHLQRPCDRCDGYGSLPALGGGRACPACCDGNQGFEPAIDWVIVGGESGTSARPFNIHWAESIVTQCRYAKIPVFVKQMGARPKVEVDGLFGEKVISNLQLKDKAGADPAEWPEGLRVQQFPKAGR